MNTSLRQFWSFLVAVWSRVGEGHFGLLAAGVAFYAMFAVFPGLGASIAIWSLVADPAVITEYLDVGEQFLPPDAAALIRGQVMGLLATSSTTLGWTTFVSITIALYSARAGVAALIEGLDVVNRSAPRPLLWGWGVDVVMTFALILALFVGLATVIAVPLALTYLPLGPLGEWLLSVLPWTAMALLVMTCLSILYRFGPNLPHEAGQPWVSVGVVVASLSWAAVSLAFSTYLANFDSYNRIYGSIGAVAALLMWLYLSVWAVLLGGAINAEMTSRRQKWQLRRARRERRSAGAKKPQT
jgi:membrane protein